MTSYGMHDNELVTSAVSVRQFYRHLQICNRFESPWVISKPGAGDHRAWMAGLQLARAAAKLGEHHELILDTESPPHLSACN